MIISTFDLLTINSKKKKHRYLKSCRFKSIILKNNMCPKTTFLEMKIFNEILHLFSKTSKPVDTSINSFQTSNSETKIKTTLTNFHKKCKIRKLYSFKIRIKKISNTSESNKIRCTQTSQEDEKSSSRFAMDLVESANKYDAPIQLHDKSDNTKDQSGLLKIRRKTVRDLKTERRNYLNDCFYHCSFNINKIAKFICLRFLLMVNMFQWMTLETVLATNNSPLSCPHQCICLSPTQVLCNTGGLTDIPVLALPTSVEHLSLTKNNFPLIRSDAFNGLRNLRKLSLDGNNITVIRPFAFRGLPRLRELSIQHTPLTVITQFAFAALQNITAILLGHNKIHKIEGYAFAGTSNVRLLLLNSNPLHKIETSAFSGLTNVEHLILPSGIKNIEPDAFSGLDSVGLIKLSFMDLSSLKAHTFRGLTHVHVLSVQESDLGVIKPNAFQGMTHVNSLNLLNNKIDAIQEFHILQEAKVKMLRLNGNHLLENPLPGAILLEGVESLNVTANHFPCDCHLHVLIEGPLANGSTTEFSTKNFCISPIYYNGKAISSVNMKTIGRCSEDLTRDTWDALPSKSGMCKVSIYILVLLIVLIISR